MSKLRTCFQGTHDDIRETLLPFAVKPNFVTYPDEAQSVSNAKLYLDPLKEHVPLLEAIGGISSNFSFPKTKLKAALQQVAEMNENTNWFRSPAEKDDWISTICRRLRNMMHCVSQAQQKETPAWYETMPGYKKNRALRA